MNFGSPRVGSNGTDMLKNNRSVLVKLLMLNGCCSRAELSKEMHLTQASISKIVNELLELDIVEEVSPQKGNKGRRIIPIQLKENSYQFIGIQLSKDHYSMGVFSVSGKCSFTESIDTSCMDPYHVIDTIASSINEYCKRFHNIISAGVSVPSPYVGSEGELLGTGENSQWQGVKIAETLRSRVQIPVYFKNDAKAGALAEWWFGNHACHVLYHILVGSDMSASLVVDGEPVVGAYGLAGNLGQVVLSTENDKIVRAVDCCSIPAFTKHANCSHFREAIAKAKAHDVDVLRKMEAFGNKLGVLISNAIFLLNPDVIVIGGKITEGGDFLLQQINTQVQRLIPAYMFSHLKIEFSNLSQHWKSQAGSVDTPVLGAVSVAIDMFLEDAARFAKRKRDV